MLNEKDITNICVEICKKVGYDFNIPVKINKRLTRTLGRVTYYKLANGYTTNTSMEFSYQLLSTATEECIQEVISHECAHYLVIEETHESHGHDAVFKAMCARINCSNNSTYYHELKYTAPENEIYKYFVKCERCGKIVSKYHRAGKVVQHPEMYHCKCGGSLRIIKNFQQKSIQICIGG